MFWVIENDRDKLKVERLYDKYGRLMYAVAYDILKDTHASEDAVQQSFIRVINYLHKIDESNGNKTRNLLVIICKGISRKSHNERKNLKTEELDEELFDNQDSVTNIIINQESLQQLLDNICKLKPIYQEVILLRYSQDFSVAEIASLLKIDSKTVQKRIERAKRKLIVAL